MSVSILIISFYLYFVLTGTHIRAYANTYTLMHEDTQTILGTGNPRHPPGLSHSSRALRFSVALRPQRLYGLLETGSPGRPPGLSHSS